MVLPIAFFIGLFVGVSKARRRDGTKFDMIHYGIVYGIAFLLLALILSIILQRTGFFL